METYDLKTTKDKVKIYRFPGVLEIANIREAGTRVKANLFRNGYYYVYDGADRDGYVKAENVAAVTIQDMIDDAAAMGQSRLVVPAGTYTVTETIQCAPGVSMDLSGVTLNAGADVDIIRVANQSNINGGFINCSLVVFTHAALVLDGVDRFDMTFPTTIQNIRMLGNWQSDAETGTGILMKCTSGFIQGVTFSNIGISYFRNGIHLQHTDGSGWVNGNVFSNLIFMICRWAIHLDGDTSGNAINNVQYQPDNACQRALLCNGSSNLINNFMVWDWPTDRPAIEFTETAMLNVLLTDLYQPQYFDDRGWGNKLITPTP